MHAKHLDVCHTPRDLSQIQKFLQRRTCVRNACNECRVIFIQNGFISYIDLIWKKRTALCQCGEKKTDICGSLLVPADAVESLTTLDILSGVTPKNSPTSSCSIGSTAFDNALAATRSDVLTTKSLLLSRD